MYFKKPSGIRKSYAVIDDNGKTLKDPRIDAINQALRDGVARDECEARLRALIASFKPKNVLTLSHVNVRLARERYKAGMKRRPNRARPKDYERRLLRAAEAMGNVSLLEASQDEIEDALIRVQQPGTRYHVLGGVNELLAQAQRPFRLFNPPPVRIEEISFIRMNAFLSQIKQLPDQFQLVLGALFATGCRWGELPRAHITGNKADIKTQITRYGTIGPTKNKKARTAPILPPLNKFALTYAKLSPENKKHIRMNSYKQIRKACMETLGLRLHDLRHSYAVEWGAVGATLSDIAKYIGDTEEVCRRRYMNYLLEDDEIARAIARFGGKK